MLGAIDTFLNKTTMYRLVVYYLGVLLLAAGVFASIGWLPFSPVHLIASTTFLIAACWLINALFAQMWGIPANKESALITALILALIITPGSPDATYPILLGASLAAMASKYLLAIRGKHLFNPAAFGVVATAFAIHKTASWWVGGNVPMMLFVIAGGVLVTRKIRRSDVVLAFFAANLAATVLVPPFNVSDMLHTLQIAIVHSSILFLAFVMLTEPLTTPPRRPERILYAAIVGVLGAPWAHVGSLYFTPELALVAGNLFAYLVSPKYKTILTLTDVKKLASDTYEFVFAGGTLPKFVPGQYAEWTLAADTADTRGNRRYFTFASSPTERDVRLGVKFYPHPSTYKTLLSDFKEGSEILVGSIAGDFVLPRDKKKKLVFIAGGIGVTPFRSMIKSLIDTHEVRDIVLIYSNKSEEEIAYREFFDEAARAGVGLRVVYTLTDNVPSTWSGERGMIDGAMIRRIVPDYRERTFYISGPQVMVQSFKKMLHTMGISRWRIKADYFPGFA